MKIKTLFRRWTFLLALLVIVPSQQALAGVLVDRSPDTTGAFPLASWVQCIGAACPNALFYQGDKFTLTTPEIIGAGSIFSGSPWGSLGDPVRFVILPDAMGAPGAVPVIDVSTTLDAVDTVLTVSQPSLTRKHASIPPRLLPAGTYWFWLAGENVEIAQATGFYDDFIAYSGFDLNPDLEAGAFAAGDTFFMIDTGGIPLPPICSAPAAPIPDAGFGSLTDTISVTGPGAIADLDVYIDASHTWVGDLSFTLDHVGGSGPVTIIDRPGVPASGFGCSQNDYDVTVNDEGPDGDIETQCDSPPAINGDRVGGDPPGPVLSSFNGDDLSGDWALTITDNFSFDAGTLNQWCLIVEVAFDTLQDCVNTLVQLTCSGVSRRNQAACNQAALSYCQSYFPDVPESPLPPRR